jgi:ferredoxin
MKGSPFKLLILFLLWVGLSVRVYHASVPALIAALSWSACLAGFYFWLGRTARQDKVRTFYFAALAFFFLFGMHRGDFTGPSGKNLQPYCHLALAGNLLQTGAQQAEAFLKNTYVHYGILGTGVFWLLVVLVCGGGFCSRVCFFGGVDDVFSRVLKKPVLKIPGGTRVREFQLAFLLFLVFVTYTHLDPEFCQWVCPFKLNTEILNASAHSYRAQVASYSVLGILSLILLPVLTRKRTFCSTLCPFGALPPLVQRWMPAQVRIEESACTACGKCETECPSFAIEKRILHPAVDSTWNRHGQSESPYFVNTATARGTKAPRRHGYDGKQSSNSNQDDIYEMRITRYCTLCMRCVPACPTGGVHASFLGRKGHGYLDLVSMGFGGALSLFYVPAGVLALMELVKRLIR